jgi:hypothetical protein
MNLVTTYYKSAKWQDDNWQVVERPSYRWENKVEQSPEFLNFKDALNWIIKHDEL